MQSLSFGDSVSCCDRRGPCLSSAQCGEKAVQVVAVSGGVCRVGWEAISRRAWTTRKDEVVTQAMSSAFPSPAAATMMMRRGKVNKTSAIPLIFM